MKALLWTLTVVGTLSLGGMAYADHNKNCGNLHGKVSVVTDTSITVNDKLIQVGETTRMTKGGEKLEKVTDIKAGDIVCVDTRGKGEPGREVAAVTVLDPTEAREVIIERERVKEKIREKK